jgi:preprotein translocase SecE subunit
MDQIKKDGPKVKKPKDPTKTFSYRTKRWFFGVGKEFGRVSWVKRKHILQDFAVIVVIVAILALIFLGIDAIYMAILK